MTISLKHTLSISPLGEVFSALDFPKTAKNPKGVKQDTQQIGYTGELRTFLTRIFTTPNFVRIALISESFGLCSKRETLLDDSKDRVERLVEKERKNKLLKL